MILALLRMIVMPLSISAPRVLLGAALAACLPLAACGGPSDAGTDGQGSEPARLEVFAGFFPLAELAREVGGDHVEVTQVAGQGADPHHLEMSPQATGALQEADLVLHLRSMQPALDAAVEAVAADHAWDAADAVDLAAGPAESHEEHEEEGHEGHDHGGKDPHFWLDPTAYAKAATSLGEELARRDPDHAQDYRDNARSYVRELEELDAELTTGLADCRVTDLVVGHQAYGWFGARYGFHQLGVAGLSNEAEVSPAHLAELTEVVRAAGVTTIYAEPLSARDNAQALADETDTRVAVLDPAAGVSGESAAQDYLGIMRANLRTLRAGQECS